ncbi:unnamed protein product [Ectocarpus sp. CCAP 1310/34]|nr:unnamed protein product [Ectocarpus sp. CCAP 1310/34]
MFRPPTMSQLLKRAGLAKRSRPAGRGVDATPSPANQSNNKRQRVDGGSSRQHASEEEEEEEEEGGSRSENGASAKDVTVDDQIAALERELKGADVSSSDAESSISSDDDNAGSKEDRGAGQERGRATKLVSPLEAEKIEPLPAHLLPRPGCGVHKDNKKKKKPSAAVGTTALPGPSQGLDSAVKELLANYEARSSERVPFYCRVCKFQGDSLEALEKHKEEPLHVEAAKKERKISKCSLCKKQFTSPPQLQEHLAGKAHLEKLQSMMSRQGKWVPGGRGGPGSEGSLNGYSGRENGGDCWRGSGARGGWAVGRGRGNDGMRGGGNDGGRGRGNPSRGRGGRGRGPGRGYENDR